MILVSVIGLVILLMMVDIHTLTMHYLKHHKLGNMIDKCIEHMKILEEQHTKMCNQACIHEQQTDVNLNASRFLIKLEID